MSSATKAVAELRAAGAELGLTLPAELRLRWGLLLEQIDPRIDGVYVAALEQIYEGYLFHYRTGRLQPVAVDHRQALLAGDLLYARGLEAIAGRGDVAAVNLLTWLMESCAHLRSREAPFTDDDALWELATRGLSALHQGLSADEVTAPFVELRHLWRRGDAADVPETARRASAAWQRLMASATTAR